MQRATRELPPLADRRPWYADISAYQWLVLLLACAGWVFDIYENQIFAVTRGNMLGELLRAPANSPDVKRWGDFINSFFLVGGAIGGILFGAIADRFGRGRSMVLSILVYAVFSALTAAAQNVWHVVVLRFLVATGTGGEWAVAAALVSEVFPKRARAHASGIFHASSILGGIDSKRGTIVHYDVLPEANDLPLRDLICRQIGEMPCVMENNIRAMTLAEWVAGAATGLTTFACVAVRSGVGCGIVINSRLRGGNHGFCGEIGYMPIPGSGSSSATSWKNLQQTVSETALGIDVESDGFSKLSDATAKRCGEIIGCQLASLATVLDPEAIVLAGGMLNPMGSVWPHVLTTFRQATFAELAERVQLLPARLGAFAAAQGAAHRAMYELFPVALTPA